MDPFIQGSEGYAVFIEDSGNEMLVSSKIIPSTGWRILALLPTVEAFAPLRSMRARIITAALLATIVVGGLIWWMTSLLLRRQFLPMVSTAKLIKAQSGENQLLRPLPITSEGEVGELISSFNVLLRALESKTIGLLESEKTMRSFFDHAPVGISISTRDGKLIYINPAMPKIMGYDSREEMMEAVSRRSISEVLYLDPGKRDSIIADLDRAGKKWTFFEDRYRTKDDCFVDAEVALGSSLDKVSGKTHIYCIMTDISKRKMAEANLLVAKIAAENANDVKSSFLAATSHDLRQPMQAMSLFNNALGRTGLNEEQKRIRGLLAMAIQSMNDLLNALLNISRLDAGSVKVQDEVVTVDALILKLEAEFPAMAAERSLRFKVRASFRKMVLVTDGKLLASLLGNLIGNAIKYTRRGGILVAIRRRGDRAVIQVWDTGIGIAEKDLGRIFDEYVQIGNSSRDRTKGLGLGLAIAWRISILLKSELVCRSRLGKGSVFEISLPLKDPVGIGAPAFGNLAVVDAGSAMEVAGCRIVIVEDDVLVAKATQLLLESLGMRVSSYGSAEEALADSDIADADFYISDFMLAGLNGLEFLNAISQRSKKPVNAVLMTGDTSSERIRIAQSSPWPVLFKPVDISGLLSALALQKS
jgi:PAS domain S-box-containing protein